MDDLINQIGNIAVVPVELRKVRLQKTELEKVRKPEKSVSLKGWCEEKLAAVKEQKKQMASSIVSGAFNEVSSSYSEGLFKEAVWKRLDKLSFELKVELLPLVSSLMEDIIYSLALDSWGKRSQGVDAAIANLEGRLPPEFSMDLVNVHKDYPASRIGYDDRGRPWDKWLTKYRYGEDSKKKIYYDPYEDWLLEYEWFYNEIHLPAWEKDQALLRQPATAPKTEPPPPFPPEQVVAIRAFLEEGQSEYPEEGTLKSRIYKKMGR